MPINPQVKPLGAVLKRAGLVSSAQIEIALQEQLQNNKLRIGEILASNGWIKPATADFFAEKWERLLQQPRQPLGQYLKEAALLDEQQIQAILQEQKQTGGRFGEIAVRRGWLGQSTLVFFLVSLQAFSRSPKDSAATATQKQQPPAKENKQPRPSTVSSAAVDSESKLRPSYPLSGVSVRREAAASRSANLTALRDRLLNNDRCNPFWLLDLYRRLLQQGEIAFENSPEQRELLKLGLAFEQQGKLKATKSSAQTELDLKWIESELARLRPYRTIKLKLEAKAECPYTVLEEILGWTNHHPLLTQKLYQLIHESETSIAAGEEARQTEQLVRTYMINNWEKGVAAEHLKGLRDRLLEKDRGTGQLLRQYGQVLQQKVPADYRWEQQELLKLGLLEVQAGELFVYNRIYQEVFNRQWVEKQLNRFLGVSMPLNKTIASESKASQAASKRHPPTTSLKRLLMLMGVAGIILAFFSIAFILFSRRSEVQVLFNRGNELFAQEDYEAAIAEYNEVLDVDANYYQAWTNRGYALAGLQDYQKMLESCRTATVIEPQATYAWNCQGEALYSLKQYREAIAAFDRAIAIEPDDPVFHINKGESLLALGELEPALADVNQAIAQFEQQYLGEESISKELAIALSLKGRILRKQQQYQEALAVYEQALAYTPQYFPARRDKALTLRALNRYQQAETELAESLDNSNLSQAQRAEAWFYRGLVLCDQSQVGAGISAFDEALKLKPDYEAAQRAKSYCL